MSSPGRQIRLLILLVSSYILVVAGIFSYWSSERDRLLAAKAFQFNLLSAQAHHLIEQRAMLLLESEYRRASAPDIWSVGSKPTTEAPLQRVRLIERIVLDQEPYTDATISGFAISAEDARRYRIWHGENLVNSQAFAIDAVTQTLTILSAMPSTTPLLLVSRWDLSPWMQHEDGRISPSRNLALRFTRLNSSINSSTESDSGKRLLHRPFNLVSERVSQPGGLDPDTCCAIEYQEQEPRVLTTPTEADTLYYLSLLVVSAFYVPLILVFYLNPSSVRMMQSSLGMMRNDLSRLFQTHPQPTIILDQELTIISCNQATSDLLKQPIDALLGHSIAHTLEPEERLSVLGELSNQTDRLHDISTVTSLTANFLRSGSDTLHCKIQVVLSVIRQQRVLILSLSDQRPLDTIRNELLLERERFSRVRELVGLGTWYQNAPDAGIEMDAGAMRIRETTVHDPRERRLTDWLASVESRDQQRVLDRLEQMWRWGGVHRYDFRIETATGDSRRISTVVTRLDARDGRPLGLFGVEVDVTDASRNEEQLSRLNEQLEATVRERTFALETANSELEAFAYSVSHDLRSPIRAINGYAEILMSRGAIQTDDFSRQQLENIARAALNMGNLVDDFLVLSRVSRADITLSEVNVSDISDRLIGQRLTREYAGTQFEIAEDIRVQADPGLMEILLGNLLENAFKFSRNASTPRVRIFSVSNKQEQLIYVEDNGVGFDAGKADLLFKPLSRICDTSEFEGTGIGLATAKRIIDKFGGRIWAQAPEPNKTQFVFSIPWVSSDTPPPEPRE